MFDRSIAGQHASGVVVSRQLSSVALTLALLAGNVAVCAGWVPTPEARMACCSAGNACPMHREDRQSNDGDPVTQAQADSCCAAAEREHSNHSSPLALVVISSAVLGSGVFVPMTAPALVTRDKWRTVAPTPITAVPKHVLLSVFLV